MASHVAAYRLEKDKWNLNHPNVPFNKARYRPLTTHKPTWNLKRYLNDDLERFETMGNNDMVIDEEDEDEDSDGIYDLIDSDDNEGGNRSDDGDGNGDIGISDAMVVA